MDGIIHIRIDDRLLHGQICGFWSSALKITRLIVANDQVAMNDLQKQVLRMAAPAGIRTSLIDVTTAATHIMEHRYVGQRVLLIVNSPVDILRMMDLGLPIKEVYIGNMGKKEGTKVYAKTIYLNTVEYQALCEIHERKVALIKQMVPDANPEDFYPYLHEGNCNK